MKGTTKTHDVKPCPECGRTIRKRSKLCAYCSPSGMTPEQREKHPLCGAIRGNGEPCKLIAGTGTDHVGIGKCRHHGGNAPSHNKAALALELKRRMVSLSEPLSEEGASPHRVLGNLMRMAGGNVEWLDAEIRKLEDLGTADAAAKLALYTQEREMTARVAKLCSEANVEQIEANLKHAEANLIVSAIRDAAHDVGLSRLHTQALGVALRARVAAATGDANAAEAAARRVADLREQITAADQKRIEREARKWSGLTFPDDEPLFIDSTAEPA